MATIVILAACAFLLGACPFSVWIGRLALDRDIRQYGDGNPGSSNVFKAGGRQWGIAALLLDLLKGTPFIVLGKSVFWLAQPYLYMIALAAILGHAYSPFLGWRGGKALATFGGTLFALEQWDMVISLVLLLLIGFLFIGNDAWTVLVAASGTLCFLLLSHKDTWEIVFLTCMVMLILVKHYHALRAGNSPGRLARWIRAHKRPA